MTNNGLGLCKNCGVFGRVETIVNRLGTSYQCYTTCKKCGRTGESARNPQDAIDNWNDGFVSYEGKNA